jgi:EAL domain-containing protein (putative c-di-GMP-specific phosphodiesterase class I)
MRIFPTRAQDRSAVDRREPDDWGDLDRDQQARQVVHSVVRLVGSLGMIALAEGVQTEQQSDIVAEERCLAGTGVPLRATVPAQRFAADLSGAPALLDPVSGA